MCPRSLKSSVLFSAFLFIFQAIPRLSAQQCGIGNPNGQTLQEKSPWTVAVMLNTGSFTEPFRFVTTGTIIGRTTVLAVFTPGNGGLIKVKGDESETRIRNVKDLVVVAGPSIPETAGVNDKSFIHFVEFATANNQQGAGGEGDVFQLVTLHLTKSFDFQKNWLKPLCFNRTATFPQESDGSSEFSIQGYGILSTQVATDKKHLGFEKVTLQNQDECLLTLLFREIVEPDLLCGIVQHGATGYSTGALLNDVWNADISSALVVKEKNGRHSLGGVAVIVDTPENDASEARNVYMTNFIRKPVFDVQDASVPLRKLHNNWIYANIKCGGKGFPCSSGKCIPLEKVCDHQTDCVGAYSNFDDEDPRVCDALNPCPTTKPILCGFKDKCVHPSQICDGIKDCNNGWDESGYQNCTSKNTIVTCTHKDRNIACDYPVPGTEARIECKPFYVAWSAKRNLRLECKDDGEWSSLKFLSCEPDCGRLARSLTPYVANGKTADSIHGFPWFASIYARRRSNSPYNYLCGGTLIDNNFMITAAHCVTSRTDGAVFSSFSKFKIVIGGIHSSFEKNQKTKGVVIAGIKQAWVPRTFAYSTLTSDIALIQLDRGVEFDENVRPVCYLNNRRELTDWAGVTGLVAGLGVDSTGNQPPQLQWGSFEHVDAEICRKNLDITIDHKEFCGKFANETALCHGDSGGGFVVKENPKDPNSRYILKGIVSRGITNKNNTCKTSGGAVLTDIDAFASWIFSVLENF